MFSREYKVYSAEEMFKTESSIVWIVWITKTIWTIRWIHKHKWRIFTTCFPENIRYTLRRSYSKLLTFGSIIRWSWIIWHKTLKVSTGMTNLLLLAWKSRIVKARKRCVSVCVSVCACVFISQTRAFVLVPVFVSVCVWVCACIHI